MCQLASPQEAPRKRDYINHNICVNVTLSSEMLHPVFPSSYFHKQNTNSGVLALLLTTVSCFAGCCIASYVTVCVSCQTVTNTPLTAFIKTSKQPGYSCIFLTFIVFSLEREESIFIHTFVSYELKPANASLRPAEAVLCDFALSADCQDPNPAQCRPFSGCC